MGRRRTQRACATVPSMLSSARCSPELLRRSASDAEVSAAAVGATGSEAALPGYRSGRSRGGRGAAATTSSTGAAEGAERGGDLPAPKPDPEPGGMDHHQLATGRYQVLHNEEDNSEPSAIEQPSASHPTAQIMQTAPSAPAPETDSSPPPYSSITVEVPTTSGMKQLVMFLIIYFLGERILAYCNYQIQEEECPPRDDFSDADQLRVGNDGIFMLAFFMAFIFNWLGFCLSFCITNTIAGRYGAICGFGLSLIKWILIVRFSDYFTGYFNGQYWLWWIFLVLGLLLFFRGFVNYLKVRNMSESMAAAHRTRYFFLL
uniref:Nedd4 family interacting protein 2 n=1 Tax=Oryctolagus cuniculus TaxID=9986 RepID=G1T5G3_RABIT